MGSLPGPGGGVDNVRLDLLDGDLLALDAHDHHHRPHPEPADYLALNSREVKALAQHEGLSPLDPPGLLAGMSDIPARALDDILRAGRARGPRARPHDTLASLGQPSTTATSIYRHLIDWVPARGLKPSVENKAPPSDALRSAYPSVLTSTFVGGTASAAGDGAAWMRLFPGDKWAEQAEGVSWYFSEGFLPDRHFEPRPSPKNHASCLVPEIRESITEKIKELEAQGCVTKICLLDHLPQHLDEILFTLPLLMVWNGKKWRLCWDGRFLNGLIECPKFRMETVSFAARLVRPGDYMFTLDLFNGYHQFALRPDMRRYCGFTWDNYAYVYNVLPFGVSIAPLTFSKIMLLLLERWRAMGIRVTGYIDDMLVMAESYDQAVAAREVILRDLATLGLQVNVDKANLEPNHCVSYLGYLFDSVNGCHLFIPEAKLDRVREQAAALLERVRRQRGARVTGTELAELVGRILSFRYGMPPARVLTRELLACMRQLPFGVLVRKGRRVITRDLTQSLELSDGAVAELEFWVTRAADWNGMPWCPAYPSKVLYTDGSTLGWSGLLERITEREKVRPVVTWAQGGHPTGLSTHSLRTELNALLQSLLEMRDVLAGSTVRHRTDSRGVQYGLANGGFRGEGSEDLNLLIRQIFLVCAHRRIILQSEYVGSEGIIRSGADALSREDQDQALLLTRSAFLRLVERWGWPEKDLFADVDCVQKGPDGHTALDFYVGRVVRHPPPGCRGLDALAATPWEGPCYAFPPSYLAQAAIEAALGSRAGASIILVLFDWPAQPWYPLLAAFESVDLGPVAEVACLIRGKRPIGQEATWRSTRLRAWFIPQNGG